MDILLRILLRLGPLALALAAILAVTARQGHDVGLLVDPQAAMLVFVIPWVVLAVGDSWSGARSTWSALFLSRAEDLPARQLRLIQSRLAHVGSLSIASGVLAAAFSLVGGFNVIASQQGQMSSSHWPILYGGYLLGPLYALLLEALLYGPARAGLRARSALDLDVFAEEAS